MKDKEKKVKVNKKKITNLDKNDIRFIDIISCSAKSGKNIEKLFKVNVVKINIINQKTKVKMKQGKKSYKSGYKKAIITLKKGQSIDLTTGI